MSVVDDRRCKRRNTREDGISALQTQEQSREHGHGQAKSLGTGAVGLRISLMHLIIAYFAYLPYVRVVIIPDAITRRTELTAIPGCTTLDNVASFKRDTRTDEIC